MVFVGIAVDVSILMTVIVGLMLACAQCAAFVPSTVTSVLITLLAYAQYAGCAISVHAQFFYELFLLHVSVCP
jgi:hypothetical protein